MASGGLMSIRDNDVLQLPAWQPLAEKEVVRISTGSGIQIGSSPI